MGARVTMLTAIAGELQGLLDRIYWRARLEG
jgi:hypothetical protein